MTDEQHPGPDPADDRPAAPADAAPTDDRPAAPAPTGDRPAPTDPTPAPDRLCRKCSTVSATTGEFCPHCGASYVRRGRLGRISRRTRGVVAAFVVLVLLAGGGTALVLQKQADDRMERRERAQRNLERIEAQARKRREDAAASKAAAAEDAAAEEVRLQRRLRTLTVRDLRKSVTKDARARAAEGLLEDRARSTDCENTDGNEDDLDETSAAYSCIAVTDVDADGSSRGYRFSARVDFEAGSYTWQLGD
ncbi:hypothetical protein [Patulibacter sp.]|uniref:hypothetical protein n=1 Tax=Patulibacter sp. TaxID=1912859 RepID=UPI002716E48D|nr:hypothetical protein [Patulibacter sp.]MDO9406774.1 hypothetical protein [Patulibacter sp.]